ncbi:NosD domain-containing protein [Mucilaginibacter lutimaris]|uniref:NosD domain-containing protein n=1 Tax=Mucilaginibacter lutimaris TaxID=931629 RepID=A0ABW2ZEN9_9SPHI
MLNILHRYTALLILILITTDVVAQSKTFKRVSIIAYGAKSNADFDNAKAITDAINHADTIVIPKGNFKIGKQVYIRKKNNKTIIATGSTVINSDDLAGSFFFENCNNITIKGGTWARQRMPDVIGKTGKEHTFTFETCKNITIKNAFINGSPQMGISLMNVITANIIGNQIQNCFRDGIYAHYSVNLKYLNNKLNNIKDDAMSVHDYGIAGQKKVLLANGYKQAGHVVVSGNVTTNTYQGFSSIGCIDVKITNNKFRNTVNAGIAVFNTEHLFPGHTSRAQKILVSKNTLFGNGYSQFIINKMYDNLGQLSSGRCAIYIAVNDKEDFIRHPLSRIKDVFVTGNTVDSCAVNGVYLAQIDGLTLKNNSFSRCNLVKNAYTYKTIEVNACTGKTILKNIVR